MDKNVGGYDRLARFVVGPVLIVVGLTALGGLVSLGTGTVSLAIAAVALLLGVVLTATATTRKCPIHSALGTNTYRGTATDRSSSEELPPETKAN